MILQKPSTVRSYVDKNSFEEVARDVKPEDVPTDFKGYGSGKPIILTSSNQRSNKLDYCSNTNYVNLELFRCNGWSGIWYDSSWWRVRLDFCQICHEMVNPSEVLDS